MKDMTKIQLAEQKSNAFELVEGISTALNSLPELSVQAAGVLHGYSQALWKEHSADQVISKFLQILRENFALQKAARIGLSGSIDKEPGSVDLAIEFDVEERRKIRDWMKSLNLKTAELRSGAQTVEIPGVGVINFVLLGDPALFWETLVWASQVSGSTKAASVDSRAYVGFLAKQLQNAFIWYQRLEQTQALLYKDDLTGVFNSRYLEIAIENEIRRSQRFQTNFCLLFVDLDRFKEINDQFGHQAGSEILKQVAVVLREAAREIDVILRYGGDEFVVLLLGAGSSTGLLAAERIRRKVAQNNFTVGGDSKHHLTVSIGVAAYPEHATDRAELLKLADQMMYCSKKSGRDRVTLYSPTEK